MKTELYTNCSLMRLPIKTGETKYYLPQNVDWAKAKIDKVLICAPDNACTDPIDGVTPVMTAADLATLSGYVSLYDEKNREIMHDVSVEHILHRNNNPLYVDSVLNLSLCSLTLMTAPAQDYTLLLYVFYQTRVEEYYEIPNRSITARFPLLPNQEISFREIINWTIHAIPAKVKGIVCWNAVTNPVYITMRDWNMTYQLTNVHSEMMRDDMNKGNAYDNQAALFNCNELDIDFDYSRIREAAGQNSEQIITFIY